MQPEPLVPHLYEMRVAWALLRYLPHEQAEVIEFFEYLDHAPTGEDVGRARKLLEAA